MSFRKICQVLILPGLIAPNVQAQNPPSSIAGNAQCQALTEEGQKLLNANKYDEALAKFQEAAKADPLASFPWSWMGVLFYQASGATSETNVKPYREKARSFAQKALSLNAVDPVGLEVMRGLSGEVQQHAYVPTREARELFLEAEKLFHNQDFKGALAKYEAAFAKDPAFASAILYAGDCYFSLQNYEAAETRYRKATELDPLNPQAWRFLGDARYRLNRPTKEISEALLGAISAQPNYMPAWARYEELRKAEDKPLAVFRLTKQAESKLNPAGKKGDIQINLADLGGSDSMDGAAWLAYGMVKASGLIEPKKGEKPKSAFETEYEAWNSALTVIRSPENKKTTSDATLRQFQAFSNGGHLKTAVFLFLFQESFRPDFEVWKKANPHAIKDFLETFSLRPPAE